MFLDNFGTSRWEGSESVEMSAFQPKRLVYENKAVKIEYHEVLQTKEITAVGQVKKNEPQVIHTCGNATPEHSVVNLLAVASTPHE